MEFKDVVVLVPGFLGFSRVGGFYYFADRVSATLRGALEGNKKRTIPVLPCCALPTDRLASRQTKLVAGLVELCKRMGDVTRLHLVGHSAGGVDAQLLTCDRPLGKPRWEPEAEWVRAKIKSVIGIAAPHHGTCLANAPIARLVADPLKELVTDPLGQLRALPEISRQLWDLSRLATGTAQTEIAWSVLGRLPESSKFLWGVLGHRGLIEDLAPRAMESTRRHWAPGGVLIRSFVTVVTKPQEGDPFFKDLYALTSDASQSPATPATSQALVRLQEHAPRAIRSQSAHPAFTDGANDGVVNSTRQLLDPSDPHELAGIVVADHADVLGHYDRQDVFVDDKPLNLGLFHSGAGFGDDQFFELYRRVAEVLAEVIP
jgi:pimeloyl-ACP methyl ester carboxylesterase